MQLVVESSDLSILVVSVYIPGRDTDTLYHKLRLIQRVIGDARRRTGTRLDVILAGDFNRHDQLWGGDNIAMSRQGEADPIVDLMSEFSLHSLLPRGTIT